jgi:hypothetical protein
MGWRWVAWASWGAVWVLPSAAWASRWAEAEGSLWEEVEGSQSVRAVGSLGVRTAKSRSVAMAAL